MARFQFKFWLDASKDSDLLLCESIDELKRNRSFASAIRDGLRPIIDLRAGRLTVLAELFPWIQDALKPVPPSGDGGGDLLPHIERLERLILSNNGNAGSGQMMNPLPDLPAGSLFVAATAQEKKASAKDARAAFTSGMGNLFGTDESEEDLWN